MIVFENQCVTYERPHFTHGWNAVAVHKDNANSLVRISLKPMIDREVLLVDQYQAKEHHGEII